MRCALATPVQHLSIALISHWNLEFRGPRLRRREAGCGDAFCAPDVGMRPKSTIERRICWQFGAVRCYPAGASQRVFDLAGRIGVSSRYQEKPMSQSVKIDFVALTSLASTPKRTGKSKTAPQTLVVFAGPDLALSAATREAVGAEGEALLKRAAGAGKFKGKGSTALDIIAPAGVSADRLLVIGTGAEETGKSKAKEEPKPDDYLARGGFGMGKL
ncbi:MAG: M17 family peptidase N-terminal domain-containing protein, partial [Methylovirgula sp.]